MIFLNTNGLLVLFIFFLLPRKLSFLQVLCCKPHSDTAPLNNFFLLLQKIRLFEKSYGANYSPKWQFLKICMSFWNANGLMSYFTVDFIAIGFSALIFWQMLYFILGSDEAEIRPILHAYLPIFSMLKTKKEA